MTLQEELNKYKLELINRQAAMYEHSVRSNEIKCIIQALELGVKREEELISEDKPMQEK